MTVFGPYDQAALDAQYNNRARVPEHPAIMRRWAEASERVRAALPGRLDLAYGPDPRERVDVFPAGPGAPIHLFIHGGYWQGLDKSSFSHFAPTVVGGGAAYAIASYPLAPAARMDAIVGSLRRAVAWLRANAAEFGADGRRVTVSGHSAGGHLAALLLAEGRAEAALAISGLFDLEPIRRSYLNAVLGMDEAEARRNSPTLHLPDAAGPLTLAVGGAESEEFLRQTEDFAAAWRARGLACEEVVVPGADHFTVLDPLERGDGPLAEALRRLL